MASNTGLTYYQKNKERIKTYAKNYYNKNKDMIKQKRDNLPQEKKDKIRKYQKEWRDNRSDEDIINRRIYANNYYNNLSEEKKN